MNDSIPTQPETKTIPLTQGKFAIVDAADYEWANQWKWYAWKHRNTFYAARTVTSNGKKHNVMMHRELLEIKERAIITDHKDGNGLNNTRDNLRPCTESQNKHNTRPRADNASGYKGICWLESTRKWKVQIRVNGKVTSLGYFSNMEDAICAYDTAARNEYGEFAWLNRPT